MDPTLFDAPSEAVTPAVPGPPLTPRPASTSRPTTATGTRDRRHVSPPRRVVLRMRLSETELADITAAATRVRLTPSGYAAEAAVTAARTQPGLRLDIVRAALTDLLSAREQLRQLTQVAAASHRSLHLSSVEVAAERAVVTLEDAASDLAQSLRQQRLDQNPPEGRRRQRSQQRRHLADDARVTSDAGAPS